MRRPQRDSAAAVAPQRRTSTGDSIAVTARGHRPGTPGLRLVTGHCGSSGPRAGRQSPRPLPSDARPAEANEPRRLLRSHALPHSRCSSGRRGRDSLMWYDASTPGVGGCLSRGSAGVLLRRCLRWWNLVTAQQVVALQCRTAAHRCRATSCSAATRGRPLRQPTPATLGLTALSHWPCDGGVRGTAARRSQGFPHAARYGPRSGAIFHGPAGRWRG